MERKSVLSELGIFYLALVITGFSFLLLFVTYLCVKHMKKSCCSNLLAKVKAKLVMTMPIQYIITGYFRLAAIQTTLFIVALRAADKLTLGLMGQTVIVLFFFLWPLMTIFFLFRNIDRLEDRVFKERYHALYDGIKIESKSSLAYQAIFAVRRWDLIFINMVFTKDFPMFYLSRSFYLEKVISFLIVQLFYIFYIHLVKPHD